MNKTFAGLLFLVFFAGCSEEPRTIVGTVVNESDVAVADAAVTACYSGWGLSRGSLVWDRDYCSAPVLTGRDGRYTIRFDGPEVMRLRVSKEGWVQMRDFSSQDARLVLTSIEKQQARSAAEAQSREEAFLRRKEGETDAAYYCRVVQSRVRPVRLRYRDEPLSVTPSFLPLPRSSAYLLAVNASAEAAHAFAAEASLKINGKFAKAQFQLQGDVAEPCDADVHLIVVSHLDDSVEGNDRVELFMPSLRALFDMQLWQE